MHSSIVYLKKHYLFLHEDLKNIFTISFISIFTKIQINIVKTIIYLYLFQILMN